MRHQLFASAAATCQKQPRLEFKGLHKERREEEGALHRTSVHYSTKAYYFLYRAASFRPQIMKAASRLIETN